MKSNPVKKITFFTSSKLINHKIYQNPQYKHIQLTVLTEIKNNTYQLKSEIRPEYVKNGVGTISIECIVRVRVWLRIYCRFVLKTHSKKQKGRGENLYGLKRGFWSHVMSTCEWKSVEYEYRCVFSLGTKKNILLIIFDVKVNGLN